MFKLKYLQNKFWLIEIYNENKKNVKFDYIYDIAYDLITRYHVCCDYESGFVFFNFKNDGKDFIENWEPFIIMEKLMS